MCFMIKKVNEKELINVGNRFEYLSFSGIHNFLIYKDNKIIGFVCGELKENGNLFIDLIEVLNKGCGLGRQVIYELFKQLKLETISGTVLYESNHRPFYFWKSLGADIDFNTYLNHVKSDYYFNLKEESILSCV